MSKQFIIIVAAIILGLFGVLMLTRDDKQSSQGSSTNSNVQPTEHVVGKGEKNVTLTEYGDFQCPACGIFYPVVKQIKADYGDQIKFQFRQFPLTSIHQNAFISARAAEAAGRQGKFFEMHDLLYENQKTWETSSDPTAQFVAYAAQLNLDGEKFKADMQSSEIADLINADLKAGKDLGVNSTPTFFLNGRKLDPNPTSYDEFKKVIDEEIAKSNS